MSDTKDVEAPAPGEPEGRPATGKERIAPDEFLFFNRHLASLARLDLPFRDGLLAMAREANTEEFRRVTKAVAADLEQGVPLADALRKFPNTFSEFYVAAVRAGEQSGNLAGCLDALGRHAHMAYRWRRMLVGVMIYPTVLLTITGLVLLFLFTCIVPRFIPIFDALNVPLPTPTRMLMQISLISHTYAFWIAMDILAVVFIFAVICRYYRRTFFYSRLVLNLPFIGSLARKSALQLFCQMLLALLRGGMSLEPALDLVSRAFGRNVFARAIADMRDAVAEGEGMGEQCKRSGLFPESMAWKLAVMEERGTLEEALEDLSNDLSLDVEIGTQNFGRVILPFIVVFFGLIVGTVVLSIFLPIFKIQQVLTNK
ncbi:MAG: type II secretion system F family protein [Planctomycetota bacterium]